MAAAPASYQQSVRSQLPVLWAVTTVRRYWVCHVASTLLGASMARVSEGFVEVESPVHARNAWRTPVPPLAGVVTEKVATAPASYHPCPVGAPVNEVTVRKYSWSHWAVWVMGPSMVIVAGFAVPV